MADPKDNSDFGNGEVGGDNSWTSPVYGTTANGDPVTVSFGQGSRSGHTDISSGHLSAADYYGTNGHDHYGPKNLFNIPTTMLQYSPRRI